MKETITSYVSFFLNLMARLVLEQPPPNYQEGMHAGRSAEFVHSVSFNIFPLYATIIKQKMNCVFLLCWVFFFFLRNCKFVFHLKKCHILEHTFQTQPSVTSVCRLQPSWGDQTQSAELACSAKPRSHDLEASAPPRA